MLPFNKRWECQVFSGINFFGSKLILEKLAISPIDLIRHKEEVWEEEYKGRELKDDEIIQAIVNHPKIMERPIVINEMKAIIGRPPENVLEIIN